VILPEFAAVAVADFRDIPDMRLDRAHVLAEPITAFGIGGLQSFSLHVVIIVNRKKCVGE